MEFGFSPEQQELRSAAAEVLRGQAPMSVVREASADPERWRPLWKTITALGWPALTVPEDAGGLGLGAVDLVALLEVAGAALLPLPLLSSAGQAVPVLVAAGAGADTLAPLTEGSVATLAHRAGGPLDLDGDDARLRGDAGLVVEAARADLLVLPVRRDGDVRVMAVPAGRGVRVEPEDCLDPTRPLARVLVDAEGADLDVVGEDGGLGLATALVAGAADLVGCADAALGRAVEHARTRRQFGRPVGSFQAVGHRLADLSLGVERARGLTWQAAAHIDERPTDAAPASVEASLAAAAACDAAVDVTKGATQVFGALAMTVEDDTHLHLRRARQQALALGGARQHYWRAATGWLRQAS
jgi:alkylation response protein AidB-like acyl-CoA dehydrogenase